MKKIFPVLLAIYVGLYSNFSFSCYPCNAVSNVTTTVNGTNLELAMTSNPNYTCAYTAEIEIVCANAAFTGVPNYFSSQITFTDLNPMDYPLTVIDISGFCPGDYKWRAIETGCDIYSPEFPFTIPGAGSPIVLTASLSNDSICNLQTTQFSSSATGGCNGLGNYIYSWNPASGLDDASIANPVATPSVTTNYTLTVSENGSCASPQTASFTIFVNPTPTATITGTTELCQNSAPPPDITISPSGANPPYTINYSLNGVTQTQLVINGAMTIQVPTSVSGTFNFSLIDIQESGPLQCQDNLNSTAQVIINPLPVADAGPDQLLCDLNDGSPSTIVLAGQGAQTLDWDLGITDNVAFVPQTGSTTYTLTVTDQNGCQDIDDVTVMVLTKPVSEFTSDVSFGNAQLGVQFTNTSHDGISYIWDFADGTSILTQTSATNEAHEFNSAGIFKVELIATNGICSDTSYVTIEVIPPMIITPPNIFSPNGDNKNDLFYVDVQNAKDFNAEIFNRWGNRMLSFQGLNQTWDGKLNGNKVVEGVYSIIYSGTDYNGDEIKGQAYFHLVE